MAAFHHPCLESRHAAFGQKRSFCFAVILASSISILDAA
jgi:hypothetical protein